MKIAIVGTGNLATALGRAWVDAGHTVLITGRRSERAGRVAGQVGARAVEPTALPPADAVVVAISWRGLNDALRLVGGPAGALTGRTVLDCTNPVDFGTGRLQGVAAERVTDLAAGAHVVKALHLFPGSTWPYAGEPGRAPVVALCGEDGKALSVAGSLVSDLAARPVVIGGLDAARQAEEVAGFVTRVALAGANPRYAVPDVG